MFANHDSNIGRAILSWGDPPPDWIRLLAEACDASNQRVVADRLGRSGGYVSRVLRREYAGSYSEAETLVRARLGDEEVACPAMGPIPLSGCVRNRRRRGPPQNQLHRLWARTCPTCPRNTDREED